MDFGYDKGNGSDVDNQNNNGGGAGDSQTKTDLSGEGKQYDANGNLITNLGEGGKGNDGGSGDDNKDKDGAGNNGGHDGGDNGDNKDKGNGGDDEIQLNPGESVQIGDDTYTVAENGDLLDKDGKVFKEAKDVKEFLKDYQTDDFDKGDDDKNKDGKTEFNIKGIQDALGYQIVDDDDKEIEYDNTPEGVVAYVNDVIEQKTSEIQEATLNTLFEKFPFAQEMINYYIANGNSLEGWNVEVDRSNITIDDNNEQQQEEIIRTAWKEQKITGDVESYIAYLKSAGLLLSTAKTELEGLQKSDKTRKEDLARKAAAAKQAHDEEMNEFWETVETAIKGREIGGYKIPEQIKIVRNGKTTMATPDDFYRYLSVIDKNGETAYARDCKAVSSEQQLNDSLLKAYIMFTGGDYSSLVDMAIKEDKVKKLRLKANESKQNVRRLTPKGNGKKSGQGIDLGY